MFDKKVLYQLLDYLRQIELAAGSGALISAYHRLDNLSNKLADMRDTAADLRRDLVDNEADPT